MWGNGLDALVLEEANMKNGVLIQQPNTFLHFDHAYDFEYSGSTYFDGAVLEYTKNNGATWLDAASLYSAGATYSGTILPESAFCSARKFRTCPYPRAQSRDRFL